MACIMGQDLMVFVGGVSVALAQSHTLEISAETISCSSKDAGGGEWETSEAGLLSFTMSTENLVGNSLNGKGFDDLFALMIAKEPVELVFTSKSTTAGKGEYYEAPKGGWTPKASTGYKGKAIITSLSMNAPNGEHATMSATFTGTGALQKLNTTSTMSLAAETATETKSSK